MTKFNITFLVSIILALFIGACCTPKNKSAYMKKTYKSIRKSVKPANVKLVNDSVIVTLPSSILFGFNSATLNMEILPKLSKFSNALNKYQKTNVLVTGYTDSVGTDEYNNKLSLQRADTAKKALMQYSVNGERIETWGLGKRHPIATNTTEEGRAENRRVEFTIMYKEK